MRNAGEGAQESVLANPFSKSDAPRNLKTTVLNGIHVLWILMERNKKSRPSESCLHFSAVKCGKSYSLSAVALEMKDDHIFQTSNWSICSDN